MNTHQAQNSAPMLADHFGYLQGRKFATEALQNLRGCTPAMIMGILATLEKGCVNKPPAEARGIMDIVTMVRVFGVMG